MMNRRGFLKSFIGAVAMVGAIHRVSQAEIVIPDNQVDREATFSESSSPYHPSYPAMHNMTIDPSMIDYLRRSGY